jgi:phosphohistidine phosphatase SixA
VRAAVDGRGAVVVAVGHQPDCSRIAAALDGGLEPPFPPAGVVRLDLPE